MSGFARQYRLLGRLGDVDLMKEETPTPPLIWWAGIVILIAIAIFEGLLIFYIPPAPYG